MVRSSGRFPRFFTVLGVLSGLLLSSSAEAQSSPPPARQSRTQPAIGFQGGVSIDPEQVFGGVFWESPRIGGRFSLRPGIDGGVGGDVRLATINIDFIARFPIGASGWHFVQGGGPVITVTKVPGLDLSDIGAGGSYIIGFAHDGGFFSEFRIGGGGSAPNLKIAAGYRIEY